MTVTKKQTATAIALAVGAALTLTGTVAMAHGGKDGGMGGRHGGFMKMEFADVDVDANGQVTVEDFKASAANRFAAADANGDGELSAEEMLAHRKAMQAERQAERGDGKGNGKDRMDGKRMGWMIEKMISKRDANGNGTLSLDEMTPEQEKLDRMIDRFDTDDDNAISQAEFDAAQKEAFMKGHRGG